MRKGGVAWRVGQRWQHGCGLGDESATTALNEPRGACEDLSKQRPPTPWCHIARDTPSCLLWRPPRQTDHHNLHPPPLASPLLLPLRRSLRQLLRVPAEAVAAHRQDRGLAAGAVRDGHAQRAQQVRGQPAGVRRGARGRGAAGGAAGGVEGIPNLPGHHCWVQLNLRHAPVSPLSSVRLLMRTSPAGRPGLWYIAEQLHGGQISGKMDHLVCFLPGRRQYHVLLLRDGPRAGAALR